MNGASFLAVLYTLYAMVLPRAEGRRRRASVRDELGEGLAYIHGNHTMLALMTLFVVPMFLGQPYMTMLTVFARDVLAIGPMGLGLLTAGSAVGSVSAALVLASLGDYQRKGALMLKALFGFGAMLLFFSLSSWPAASILLVTGVGAMSTVYAASNNTIIQLLAPDNLRGRLLSVMTLERGLVPLGTAMAGASAAVVGAPLAIGTMASLIAVLALAAWRLVPSLADLK